MSEASTGHGSGAGGLPAERVELWLSRLLRGGVLVSLALVVLGTAITYVRHGREMFTAQPSFEAWRAQQIPVHTLAEVVAAVGAGRGRGVVALGLLCLIATPIIRVALSIFIFRAQHDRRFATLTAMVLALLLLSLLLGRAGG